MNIPERIIFWDWNGTLLDDAVTCLETMNKMLERRNMPVLNLELYKEVFGFPVIDYYQKIGFDFNRESFETLSVEFIKAYHEALSAAPLAGGVREILQHFREVGKQNLIISAMKHDMLIQSVSAHELDCYFDAILGIDNIYAASKSIMARDYVQKEGINPDDILFIGDTTHDFEVAEDLGCRCILIADGHQSEERLKTTGAIVLPSLLAMKDTIVPKSF
ncbi:MAG: HAD family hydrolase [Bacteroidales bacterium]|nr:HAD family hydrolase [Bacteroidales bacterium]